MASLYTIWKTAGTDTPGNPLTTAERVTRHLDAADPDLAPSRPLTARDYIAGLIGLAIFAALYYLTH